VSELTGSAAEVVDAVDLTVAPARDAVRPLVGRLRVIGIGAALAGATLLAAIRVKPQVWGDPGVWLSVGARLLDGDRLYADVFDNKDPLFFYDYAAALWVGGVRGPFLVEILWLGLGTGAMALALRTLCVGTLAMLAGALVYPFALTAAWYVPGATMVPALALAPVALWLWVRGSTFWAGVVVVVSMLLKLNLALVVAAPLVALLALGGGSIPRRRRALEAMGGATLALLVAAFVLGVRGELRPYLDTILYNVHYSNAGVHEGGIRAHLAIIREFFAASGKWQLPAAELTATILLVTVVIGWLRLGWVFKRLSAVAVAALAASFLTLALTAVFVEHLQLLSYPAALGAATLVVALRSLGKPAGAVTAVVVVLFAGWSSLKHEDLSRLTLRTWTTEPLSTPGLTLEAARARFVGKAGRVTYAVFGRNTEDGHAAFVDETIDLRCRYFHQYPFYRASQLQETIDCARREKPMLLLVTTSLYDPMPGRPAWEAFVASTRALLDSRYELVAQQGMSQVWRQRGVEGVAG
jgi:hypothetical protein